MTQEEIKSNIEQVYEQIHAAEQKSGRKSGSVKLCAVSKFHPLEDIYAAMTAGQVLFGENRVQEAYAKFSELRQDGRQAELHIIGALQTNKVKKAVEIASCIQSVDRKELLAEIEKHCSKLDKKLPVFFELHTGEDSKTGFSDEDSLQEAIAQCAEGLYPHIVPSGLMTMAPFTDDEALIHRSFERLRKCKEKLNETFPAISLTELSMGMSGDFAIAIAEGSTMVRVGTAIFGERIYS